MSSPSDRLTPELASQFARIALGHVVREYPNKMDHVLSGPLDVKGPRELHPIFFGSFDWHSCVHGYWTLATVLRLHPEIPEAPTIRALFDETFTVAKVEIECAYVDQPSARGFERPYGWAWLLHLHTELTRHDDPWAATLEPLALRFVRRFREFLPKAVYPIRTGVHSSTAFALTLAFGSPLVADDAGVFQMMLERPLQWHHDDQDAQAWEPSLDDFLSPTLMAAVCIGQVMSKGAFPSWFDAYLPAAGSRRPPTLFTPAVSPDRSDGKMAHLDGLNLSRAWCWREIAAHLPDDHPARSAIQAAAQEHLAAALLHVTGDYMGEHWLASFALLALTAP